MKKTGPKKLRRPSPKNKDDLAQKNEDDLDDLAHPSRIINDMPFHTIGV